jgi:hypothetical protein
MDRAIAHEIAEQMDLIHESSTTLSGRLLTVRKKPIPTKVSLNGLAVVEVYSTCAMTDDKVTKLNESNVPWIEIQAKPSFYLPGARQWNFNKPLKVLRCSELFPRAGGKLWVCDDCTSGLQDQLKFIRLAGIVDFYSAPEKESGAGKAIRSIYSILEKKNSQGVTEGFYLVEGYVIVTNIRLLGNLM